MKVVHVAEYASGGVATYLINLVEHQLSDPKIEHIYLFVSDKKSEKFRFSSDKVTIIRYAYNRSLFGTIKLFGQVNKIRKFTPNIIHFHSTFAGLLRIVPRRILTGSNDSRYVYCAHGWAFGRNVSLLKKRIYAFVEKILARHTDVIVNISQSEYRLARTFGVPVINMQTVLNTIAIEPEEMIQSKLHSDGTLRILFVGRLDQQKGVDILLQAVEGLHRPREVRIVGDQVLGDTTDVKMNMRLQDVLFLGWLDHAQIAQELQRADVLVVPSRWEGFGLVALEAMNAKTAVISSDAGGLPEIVKEGATGYLFKNGSVTMLQKILESADIDKLHEMGETGYAILRENFDPQLMEEKICALYEGKR